MSQPSQQELTEMKQTWLDVDDRQALQEQGYCMTQLMWKERHEKLKLSKQCDELVKENENLHVILHTTQDMADLTFANFKNTLDTILKLSTKTDGSPLNNEMAQVVAVIQNIKKKQEVDLKDCKQNYLRRAVIVEKRLQDKK